jgi:MoxR-like ATPase
VVVDYPDVAAERAILRLVREEMIKLGDQSTPAADSSSDTRNETPTENLIGSDSIFAARQASLGLYMSDAVEEYIVQLVIATRQPEQYDKALANLLDYGASPRATLALDRCARANAWLRGSEFVTPDDVQAVAHDVLRHRIIVSFEAEANGIDANQVISALLAKVPVT